MKKLTTVALLLVGMAFLSSCTWNPIIVKKGTFVPADTLDKKELEVGIQSFYYIPGYLFAGYGIGDRFEVSTNIGLISSNANNLTLNFYYQLFENRLFLLTGRFAESLFFNTEHDFTAVDSIIGITPGIRPWPFLTFYAPLNFDYLNGGSWGKGFGLNLGGGINFEMKKLRFAVEFNGNIPNETGKIDILPYLGAGLFLKF